MYELCAVLVHDRFVTCEPCIMCAAALSHIKIGECAYAHEWLPQLLVIGKYYANFFMVTSSYIERTA
jgi:hypothetical protein